MRHDFLGELTELEQADAIAAQGVLISERTEGFYKICLYQVDGFYAEIFYHAHFNVIIRIRSFSNTALLEPYLQQINISDLF